MRAAPALRPFRLAALALPLLASSCSEPEKYDWRNREIAWSYGPTNQTARAEHLKATGTKGPGAMSVGWKVRLSDAKKLTIRPYQLAGAHALFGEVVMSISLFDRDGKRLETVQSDPVTASNATFSFDISEDLAKALYDVVIWFRRP